MAIQIIDNFNLSVAKPIDDRFVVGSQSFYTNRNNIPYKYTGLRIWDLNDGVPYVWNGTTWASENSISVSGSGNVNYVPKFIGSGISNTIGESCIYISGASVGVNTDSSITTGYNLDVNGGIISQGATGFSGVGALLTNLNATNISTGLMSLSRLTNYTSSGWILTSGASQPIYTNPYSITVGAASASTVVNAAADTTVYHLGFFNAGSISGSGTYQSRVSVVTTSEDATRRQLTYKPSTGNLTSALMSTGTFSVGTINSTSTSLIISVSSANKLFVESSYVNFGTYSTGTPRISFSASPSAALPSYTWYGDTNTGMYRPSADTIGFSTNGLERMRINSGGGIQIVDSTVSINATYSISGASFTIGSNTNLITFMSVATQSHDRIVYCNTNSSTQYLGNYWTAGTFWSIYEITNGSSTICVKEMAVGDSSRSGISQFNHSFILPAGWSFIMKGYSISFTTNNGAQYGAIQVKTIRLGLS